MAAERRATAIWEGNLFEGSGKVAMESSGIGEFDVT
jgi:osmotically inducible protein OsmC